MSPKTRENTPFYKVFISNNFLKLIYIIILYINLSDQIILNCGYKLDITVLYTNLIKKIKKYVNLFCISYFK